jgi:redox-sensing transcriptional repressor
MEHVKKAGVRGILNFAPTKLKVPSGVAVKDVNMVMELEALSFALSQEDEEE